MLPQTGSAFGYVISVLQMSTRKGHVVHTVIYQVYRFAPHLLQEASVDNT